jgi:LmbE family N-acetylglucosaminyl deacetylase
VTSHGPPGITVDLPVPQRALAVAAHPDDVEFGCGATLAKWAAAGCEIHHLVCTDGSKGSWDPDEDVARLVAVRQDEQRAASRALGGKGEVVFLGWPDGELEAGLRQRWEVAYWIRALRPDVVLGHDPWRRYRLHPDHRHAGFLVTDGIVAARDPHFFPEQGEAPHRPDRLLLWEADEPDHVEDATGFIDAKLAPLLEHRSQFRSTMHIDDPSATAEVDAFRTRMLERLAEHGALAGLAHGEAFKRIDRL